MTLRKLLISLSCTELLSCIEDSDNDVLLFETSVEDNAKDIVYAENETSAFVLDEFEENANTVLPLER
jgi:hypothetical protein